MDVLLRRYEAMGGDMRRYEAMRRRWMCCCGDMRRWEAMWQRWMRCGGDVVAMWWRCGDDGCNVVAVVGVWWYSSVIRLIQWGELPQMHPVRVWGLEERFRASFIQFGGGKVPIGLSGL